MHPPRQCYNPEFLRRKCIQGTTPCTSGSLAGTLPSRVHEAHKKRLVDAVDALAGEGIAADELAMHPEYARELGVNATHLDLGSDAWAHSAASIVAELTHPAYDARSAHDPHAGGALSKPKSAAEAQKLGAERCQAHFKRPGVVLAVRLDANVPNGKLRLTGAAPKSKDA